MKFKLLKATGWFLLAGVFLCLFLITFGKNNYDGNDSVFILDIVLSISITVILSIGQMACYNYLSSFFDYSKGIARRVVGILGITSIIVSVNMAIIVVLVHFLVYVPNPEFCKKGLTLGAIMKENIGIALVMNLLIVTTTEGVQLFKKWKASLILAEQLQKEKAEAELNALKSQVNPHFLFNSLNTLNSIMQQSVPNAEVFIERFSSLYRYVLKVKDKSFVPLSDEIRLANDYIYLQQQRFGGALVVNFDMQKIRDYHLPPLCIHELLENAIKHNKLNHEAPLIIDVSIEKEYLKVKNNYNPISNTKNGEQSGQKNIIRRYELLNLSLPRVNIQDGYYSVEIQLLTS